MSKGRRPHGQPSDAAPQGAVSVSRSLDVGREAAPEAEDIAESIRVRIVNYKVFTSIGRLIAGQIESLPAAEAQGLIDKGEAKPCP